MELFFNEQKVKKVQGHTVTQALVEGEIPFPEGTEIRKLLDCMGEVETESVNVSEGTVSISGRIKLDFICEDTEGEMLSFTSWAGLEHEISIDGAEKGMEAEISISLQSLDTRLKEGVIVLTAVVDIDCKVVAGEALKTMYKIDAVEDTQFKTEVFTCFDTFKIGGGLFRIRDEINALNISSVIYASGNVVFNDIKTEGIEALITGNLLVDLLYLDKNGEYRSDLYTLPFNETLETEGNYSNISCNGKVEKINVRVIGEEFDLAAVETQVRIEAFACQENRVSLPVDAYSPSCAFECEKENVRLLLNYPNSVFNDTFTEIVNIPEGMAEAARVLWCSASASVTSTNTENGILTVDGVLFLRSVYQCEKGILHSFSEDIPFRSENKVSVPDGTEAEVKVLNVCTSCSGNGKSIEVTFDLTFCAKMYSMTKASIVSGIRECEAREVPHGIIVYAAGEHESLFDIGKRFNVSCNRLLETDPDICEKLRDGKKIILFV
ncbi:MAG: DUF3794 domain-containing protein [Clostridia bacterium]|nr:DUF3794 domain-containing protein [Clostridia bacterium]